MKETVWTFNDPVERLHYIEPHGREARPSRRRAGLSSARPTFEKRSGFASGPLQPVARHASFSSTARRRLGFAR
jgi:hypothetical protein